ncbi:cytochrome c-550 PedF [Salipiger sp. 1_MG-2023]|uniref:cytochrome c-550 PedF n=1 Tax=Salipiger sp. 1_MG-2023 TaxID=3062665 RepID=UPI0026E22B4B|nr:cytochrome c-550 PedF [Salipiger sp. 1_MG-2023]MDO6585418.1 cytochrome c-550 PedF [Salipiger sp. 1_MG-2023]
MTRAALASAAALFSASLALAHGDVAPQPVNTDALPDIGEDWLTENPYRDAGEEVWQAAVSIGASGYNQNCARCHGLEVISGGLAPDLRFLEAEEYGDEWFMERFREGYTQNGITKMPAFGELLGQKAAWAIRTYVETRPDDAMIDERQDELKAIRDHLASGDVDVDATVARLTEIAGEIETLSGAPIADSIAFRAAGQLQAHPDDLTHAAETLTIGLSAAH